MRIYKYVLKAKDEQVIKIKGLAKVLSVAEQDNNIVLYAQVDDNPHEYALAVDIVGTGHEYAFQKEFLGTVKLHDGAIMFHIFYSTRY